MIVASSSDEPEGERFLTGVTGRRELSIIIGIDNRHFETAVRVMYDGFTG